MDIRQIKGMKVALSIVISMFGTGGIVWAYMEYRIDNLKTQLEQNNQIVEMNEKLYGLFTQHYKLLEENKAINARLISEHGHKSREYLNFRTEGDPELRLNEARIGQTQKQISEVRSIIVELTGKQDMELLRPWPVINMRFLINDEENHNQAIVDQEP